MNSSQALSRGGPLLHSDWELLGTVSSVLHWHLHLQGAFTPIISFYLHNTPTR